VRSLTEGLFEPHHGSLDMLTHRTFKGPKVVPRLLRLNARQIHLRRACWALGSYDNRRVCKRVFGKGHLKLPVYRREYRNSQPPTPGPRSLSVMYLNTICSYAELCETAHFPGLWITGLPCNPCELFDTDSERRSGSKSQTPGASKPPRSPSACAVKTCVQDPSEASLGSLFLSVGMTSAP
jgi:hypothetical protein